MRKMEQPPKPTPTSDADEEEVNPSTSPKRTGVAVQQRRMRRRAQGRRAGGAHQANARSKGERPAERVGGEGGEEDGPEERGIRLLRPRRARGDQAQARRRRQAVDARTREEGPPQNRHCEEGGEVVVMMSRLAERCTGV